MLGIDDPLLAWQLDEACALAGSVRERYREETTRPPEADPTMPAPGSVRYVGSGDDQRKIVTGYSISVDENDPDYDGL